MSHTLLESHSAVLLNRILSGDTLDEKELPRNGQVPAWERSLIWDVYKADNPRDQFESYINGYSNSKELDDQVCQADGDFSHLFEDGDRRKESHLKREDYVKTLSALGYKFHLNVCTDRVEVNGKPISDIVEMEINSHLRDIGLRQVNVARDHYFAFAKMTGKYHPVHKYLESLEWDGENHIAALATYFNDKHNAFAFQIKRFLIGAVYKAYTGGRTRMLVLDGDQQLGKSYFVRWLIPEKHRKNLFVESPIDPDIKDHKIRLCDVWMWEVSELGSTTRRADREALKHFLSMEQVTVRVPYARYAISKPALSSFVGTLNNEAGFLNDPTGHSRYMTVHLESIDWGYSEEIDINQVWAQAYHLYKSGEPWKPEGRELEIVNAINEGYEISDPLVDLFNTLFEIDPERKDWWMASNHIRSILKEQDWALGYPRGESMAIAAEMRKRECQEKKGKDLNTGARVNGYTGIRIRPQPLKDQEEIPGWQN